MKAFTVGPGEEGMRLSRFVQRVTWHLPGSLMYKSFRQKRMKVNGKRAEADTILQSGDLIELYLNDEFFVNEPASISPLPSIDPSIFSTLYEDANIAILLKPAGLLCHGDENGQPGLAEAYAATLNAQKSYSITSKNGFAPAVATRLDRNTEGLVLLAKNHPALREANRLVREGELTKKYLCLTIGRPPEGDFYAYLERNMKTHTVQIYANARPGAKPIETQVQLLLEKAGLCLCEIGLPTGRTHQIRAHLAYLGAPLLGDAKYGGAQRAGFPGPGQALCAYQLEFCKNLPNTSPLAYLAGKRFTAPQPALLEFWQNLPVREPV